MSQDLLLQFARKLGLPAEAINSNALSAQMVDLAKDEIWVRTAERSDRVGLLVSGLMRKYLSDAEGLEVTADIFFPNDFVATYMELLKGLPSALTIQAVEASSLIVVSYAAIRRLVESDPHWCQAGRRVAEMLFIQKEERELQLLSMTARQKLDHFTGLHPDALTKLPKRVIASYLGINPSTLSRLLKPKKGRLSANT